MGKHNAYQGLHATTSILRTSFGYSSKLWDAASQLQNLREGHYNLANARFNSPILIAGSTQDSYSLHKYGYLQGNAVLGVDYNQVMSIRDLNFTVGQGCYAGMLFDFEQSI